MTDEPPKKKYPLTPYALWIRTPPRQYSLQKGFVNKQQKMFYVVMMGLTVAKVLAIALLALFIIGWL